MSFVDALVDRVWRTRGGRVLAGLCAATGVIAGCAEAIKAWPEINPYRPALIFEVDDRVAEYRPQIDQLMRWRIEDLIAKQDERASALDAEAVQLTGKLPNEDATTRGIFENRLHAIKQEKQEIEKRKDRLGHRLKTLGGGEAE